MSQETVGLVVNGTMEIAPEDREKCVALVQENVAQTQGIPGCIFYTFTADVRNPNLFHNVEAWTNRAYPTENTSRDKERARVSIGVA
jgi:quinol monooxygenase YgiN